MDDTRRVGSRWWYVLLLIPIIGLLATPIYTHSDPELFGFPFFYWYQFAWVPVAALITGLVYVRTRTRGTPPDERDLDGAALTAPPASGARTEPGR